GASGGVFHDRAAWRETTVGLGGLDHRERHAVLHAARGVLALDLEQDAGTVRRRDAGERDEGRVADAVQDGSRRGGRGHTDAPGDRGRIEIERYVPMGAGRYWQQRHL